MIRTIVRLCLFIIIIKLNFSECASFIAYSQSGFNADKYNAVHSYKNQPGSQNPTPLAEALSKSAKRGLAISAWGIVTLILTVILLSVAIYYFLMCYPILCKKERKDDMIKMSVV